MANKHKLDIEKIIDMILDGKSFRVIAKELDCPLSTLHDFTSKSEHSARAREALEYSAQTFDDKAEDVLINAKGTMTEVQRARELAQHYRWRASKRNPKKYGDKIQTELSGAISLKQITGMEIK